MESADVIYKILEVIAILIGGIVGFGRIMTKVAQIEVQLKSDIFNMKDKMLSYERQDERIMNKLDEISGRMSDFQLLELEVKNSQEKINYLNNQHEKIMNKLEEISGHINIINVTMQNKENRK